jgi:1,4-dihydroxy-2-naphthoyl-CoA synthase
VTATQFEDIRYELDGAAAVVTIARPERYNAVRGLTVEELIAAFRAAWAERSVRVIILTGESNRAFCSGGDVKQRAETGDYGPTKSGLWEVDYFHKLIRDIPRMRSRCRSGNHAYGVPSPPEQRSPSGR